LTERQLNILSALARAEQRLEAEGRPEREFILLRLPRGEVGLKPGLNAGDGPIPREGEVRELEDAGYLTTRGSSSTGVVTVMSLTEEARLTVARPRVALDVQRAPERAEIALTVAPTADEVLSWLAGIDQRPGGAVHLADGSALVQLIVNEFPYEHANIVVRRIRGLLADGLVDFDEPDAPIDQISEMEQLASVRGVRITIAGSDRLQDMEATGPSPAVIFQTISAQHIEQIAGRDVNNITTFDEFLDAAEAAIAQAEDVPEDAKDEARGLLDKLRAGGGTIATGSAASAGGAVLAGILKNLFGLG